MIKGAISLGNDTDTTAAIAGGLAAVAYQGYSGSVDSKAAGAGSARKAVSAAVIKSGYEGSLDLYQLMSNVLSQ